MTDLSAERARELLDYDPMTGVFRWRVASAQKIKIGDVAGTPHGIGYRKIKIRGKLFLEHRLAWLYVTGSWPKDQIDHINGIKDDNRFANLREASVLDNNRNVGLRAANKSGFKGVRLYRSGKWVARIAIGGKEKHLGYFSTPEAAYAAYVDASKKYHGQFSRVA